MGIIIRDELIWGTVNKLIMLGILARINVSFINAADIVPSKAGVGNLRLRSHMRLFSPSPLAPCGFDKIFNMEMNLLFFNLQCYSSLF